jgi:hypothetical protein
VKKFVSLLLVLCLVLGIASVALAAGAPRINRHPESKTTNKNRQVTFSIDAENFSQKESGWRFVNPATGEEFNVIQLRDDVFKSEKFDYKASDKKKKITLLNVPDAMHGWEVYMHLAGNGYELDSERVRLWCYGLEEGQIPASATDAVPEEQPVEQPPEEQPPVEQPVEQSPVEQPVEQSPVEQPVEQPPVEQPAEQPVELPAETPEEQPAEEPELSYNPDEPRIITVTADNVTLCPVDARGNLLEDQAAAILTFENSGSVAVRSDVPVKYWLINGIRIEPVESVTGFVLKNVMTDLSISAKLDQAGSATEVDPNTPCQVTCTGCSFTYRKGGLSSVTSGTVPLGATIIVFTDNADAGYSINGGAPEHAGSTSFRLEITGDTTIAVQ